MNISWKAYSIWVLKGNIVTWAINALVFGLLVLTGLSASDLVASGFFSKICLLETGVAFLIGGLIAFSGSVLPSKARENIRKSGEEWSMDKLQKGEKRANKFIVLAVVLFLESLAVSFV